MVSNVLKMSAQQLVELIRGFRETYADDPEYQELRGQFPDDWPM